MKKQIVFIAFLLIAGAAAVNAQGPQRRTVEERVKMTMEKVTPALALDKTQESRTDSVFSDYYKGMDKIRESMQPGTPPDRAVFEKAVTERDERLKAILTPEQFKKFKDEVEPSLRPQRRQQGQ
ncbi:MAG: hypothetical protein WCF67_01285 [Chitinophagaceae bacterium]